LDSFIHAFKGIHFEDREFVTERWMMADVKVSFV